MLFTFGEVLNWASQEAIYKVKRRGISKADHKKYTRQKGQCRAICLCLREYSFVETNVTSCLDSISSFPMQPNVHIKAHTDEKLDQHLSHSKPHCSQYNAMNSYCVNMVYFTILHIPCGIK